MKKLIFTFLMIIPSVHLMAQTHQNESTSPSHFIEGKSLETLMQKPSCLEGYIPNQSGPLYKIGTDDDLPDDSTFTIEHLSIPSGGLMINGWLYLPLGEGKFPLLVLTNGGGDDSRPIRNLSDWIAPILAHCGIAAFVHDKRGTGRSEGIFTETTYNDYITDAGNCAVYLSGHKRINPDLIGVMGGSEGGRIAVLAASRYPAIKYVISFAGTVVSMQDDRIYAPMGSWKDQGINDSLSQLLKPIWQRSFAAWASNNPAEHEKVNKEIMEMRKVFDRDKLPLTKAEMDTMAECRALLSTWYSMPNDYLTELGHFNKKWLAIFGEDDRVVPTMASIKNIKHYMAISGNTDYYIVVLPRCGHAPVDTETKRMIRIDNLIINWMNNNIIR